MRAPRFFANLAFALSLSLAALPSSAQTCQAGVPLANTPMLQSSSDYSDNANGTVTHNKTGLMWKRCAEGQSWSGGTCSAVASATSMTWKNSLAAAKNSSFAGYTDWRLPNINELMSISEECGDSPAINTAQFPNTPQSGFWSSTPRNLAGYAWAVSFYSGTLQTQESIVGNYVRLVRAGAAADSFDALSLPDAPTLSTGLPGNASVSLTFLPNGSGAFPIDNFRVTCNPGGFASLGAASPINVTGLTNGTAYTCTVAAHNAAGWGPESWSISLTPTIPATPPSAPNGVIATPGPGQVSVTFTAPVSPGTVTGGSPATIVGYSANCGGIVQAGISSPMVVTGLTPGASVTCQVTAINSAGLSATSAAVGPVTVRAVVSYTAPSATGSGSITASFTGGGAGCTYTTARYIPLTGHPASPPSGTAPAGVQFPHGLFDFVLSGCTPGSTVNFTVAYPQALPAGTQYWKYGPTAANTIPHWYVLPASISGNQASFSITDGGLGDDDLAANGSIVDQGGPGNQNLTTVPTLSTWALGLLALLLGMMGALRRRVR